jgi:hypothetical protein
VITSVYHTIEHNEAEFLHLIGEFPNSRFIARAYCRFLRNIATDHGAHKQWEQNGVALQRGQRIVPDQAQTPGLRVPLPSSRVGARHDGSANAGNHGDLPWRRSQRHGPGEGGYFHHVMGRLHICIASGSLTETSNSRTFSYRPTDTQNSPTSDSVVSCRATRGPGTHSVRRQK